MQSPHAKTSGRLVGGHGAAGGDRAQDRAGPVHALQRGREAQVDVVSSHLLLHQRGHRLVDVGHDLREHLDDSDPDAALVQRLGHLQPDVAAADHQRATDAARVEQAAQPHRRLEPCR
jgi:hypothetical protein